MQPAMAHALGIDIGGSGIKAAVVDLEAGTLVSDRRRVETPRPATPAAVAGEVRQLVQSFEWAGLVGATFPAVVQLGVARTAANVDPSWIGTDVAAALTEAVELPVIVVNDADAAGLAELRLGAAKGASGTVLVLTFGTGIGSAVFTDGVLVANTELGHVELDGYDAEVRAADSAREREGLSWSKWAARVQIYLQHLEKLLSPDLFIVGGGVSRHADKWLPKLDLRAPIRVAAFANNAGIIGAALIAAQGAIPVVPVVPVVPVGDRPTCS
jgi:polyphosphate glucokinase